MQRAVRLLFLGFAVGMFGAVFLTATSARAAYPTLQVAIDANTAGNSDNALGPTDACNATPLQVGDTIDIDVVIRGIPPSAQLDVNRYTGGIAGFATNLLFDPTVVQVNDIQAFDGPTILKAGGHPVPFAVLNYDGRYVDPRAEPPGVSGNVRVDMVDLTPRYESGDGVLVRFTLQAVGNGVTRLDLEDSIGNTITPNVSAADGHTYDATKSNAALVVGSGECTGQTPGPFPSPTVLPQPSGSPTTTPVGHYTMTLQPDTIPLNQDAVVTIEATADGPGLAYFGVTVALGPGVTFISCSSDADCATSAGDPPKVQLGSLSGIPHIGTFIVGQLTVHATGASRNTAVEITQIISAQDHFGHDLSANLTIINAKVTAVSPTPTPSPALSPTPTVAATVAPTPSPATLPHTGGAPAPRGSAWPTGVALLGAVIILAAAFVMGRRRLG